FFPYIYSLLRRHLPRSTLFPYTTLFRSYLDRGADRGKNKIVSFDYFGHSNSDCMMFDYSNEVGSASKAWLHKNELRSKLKKGILDRKSTRLNSSHQIISYAVFCLKKKKK